MLIILQSSDTFSPWFSLEGNQQPGLQSKSFCCKKRYSGIRNEKLSLLTLSLVRQGLYMSEMGRLLARFKISK